MRNFGIASGRSALGGTSDRSSAYSADTRTDPYPLPAHSLRPDPIGDADRSNIAGHFAVIVISLCFLIPMILAGIMIHFR